MCSLFKKFGKLFPLGAALILLVLSVPQVWGRGASGQSSPLVLYTNSGGDQRADWLAEKSKSAGFDVQVMNMGGGDLVNRLIAEKNNPVADIVFGPNAIDLGKLVKADVLYKFEPAWLNKIDSTLADPSGLFYAIGTVPLIMFYNTNIYTPATVAKDWVDLATNPAYRGKYQLLGLGGGTARSIIASILVEYADPRGVYGISDQGWDVMRQFIQNGTLEQTGSDWFGDIMTGEEYSIGELWLPGLLMRKAERNAPYMDFVVPQKGVPYVWEGIAIVKNGKNEARAKQWVDWIGSAEIQSEWSERFGHIPTNRDTHSTFTPELREAMARCHPQNVDWALVAENLDQWMEKIQLEFVR
jgi:iron(III) transport system substrate-binding protein